MGRITWHGKQPRRNVRSPLAEHFGHKLLELRQEYQVSMRQVAEDTGLSHAFICQLENGESVPTIETVWRLAYYFDVSCGWFLDDYQDSRPGGEEDE